jgi:chromosome partitioning protein
MQRILIVSPKGGCGKSTVTTNLGAFFVREGKRTLVMDCDHQSSTGEWARVRGHAVPAVPVLDSADSGGQGFGSWTLRIPPSTEVLLIDTPAGLRQHQIVELLRRCDTVLVPLVPSAMDLRATLPFLSELKQTQAVRAGAVRVGLVANRMKSRTLAAREFGSLATALPFPVVASIRDTQAYVLAAALGRSVFDYTTAATQECRDDWQPLLRWLTRPHEAAGQAELGLAQAKSTVVPFERN